MLKKLSQAIKRSGRSEKLEEVEELDKIGEMCSLVTSTVDDFVIAAEPPLSYEALKEAVSRDYFRKFNHSHSFARFVMLPLKDLINYFFFV